MAETSPELVARKIDKTRDDLLRHSDAVDTKAGVLLGFAGVFVAVSLASFTWWRVPATVAAVVAALWCLAIFLPDRYPTLEVRQLRDRYLDVEPAFTLRHLMDTEIVMLEQHSLVVRANARALRWATRMLVLATLLLILGTLIDQIGG
jgi:hypothetical protein